MNALQQRVGEAGESPCGSRCESADIARHLSGASGGGQASVHRLTTSATQGSRRGWLQSVSAGFGWLAFAGLAGAAQAAGGGAVTATGLHHRARAKRVIFLCMQGGPSQLDTFDYKPRLQRDDGKTGHGRGGATLYGSPFEFRRHGASGLWISELFPRLARHADDLCVVRSMRTDLPNHPQAFVQLHTGSAQFVRPSMGAWVLHGLGSENHNLPGFVTVNPPPQFGAQNYGSAFLPASCQGTRLTAGRGPGAEYTLGNLRHPSLRPDAQRRQLDFVQSLNRDFSAGTDAHPEVEGAIASMELAFRMQTEVPAVLDLKSESAETLARYGIGGGETDAFGRQCLLARRLAEAGVRFVELGHGGWDQHQNLRADLAKNCRQIDQPIAALLGDLRARGMLDDTLVVWGGEFGRTPDNRRSDGRDHNAKGFTYWMAGGGTRGGLAYGATDELGYEAVEDKVHIHDLHATILHVLGIDHERLTFRFGGRDHRLTDVHGEVVRAILA